ncbi:SOCS box domain [Trinorchestia longiramus]|nr:SOCS box domain [Trinorchestia longiramus]
MSQQKVKTGSKELKDNDQVNILSLLTQQNDEHWLPWHQKTPLLHLACERGAWNCVKHLTAERPEEINQCCDENYPIHQAALHHIKFLELLISMGADTTVRTSTQQMTVLHVVFLLGKKSAEDTLETVKLLLQHGLKEHINTPDSLGNTPLHALFVRYALEEGRYGYDQDPPPWNKWELLHIVRYLLQHGARASINQPGNSALASVLRHVKDWEFRYELLDMLLSNGGNPNLVGRDGSVPLMVCLVPLINKDPLHHFTHTMKVLHVVFLLGKKSAEDTLETVKLLLQHGLKEHINTPDSLGNTPLHALFVRYALEEGRYGYDQDPPPWNKWELLHIVRYLLQHGARASINQPGNSALASVLRHVKDWEFRYELLDMLLSNGGNPNLVGRDGSVPLMVCLVPLINKDPLHHFTHTMKIFYLNCVRILCKNGANPNCSSRSNLTPLHVLMFTASENIALSREEMKAGAFSFIQQLLVIMLQHGLDPNVRFSERSQHILLALMDMVQNARSPADLVYVHELTATLLQYGANPNISISSTEPIICHSQSSVFLKRSANQVLYYYVQLLVRKEELLKDSEQRFARLLYLYYYSMNHVPLYQCLKILHRQTALLPMKQPLANILGELYTKPRSLKQICRVVIYNALDRRAAPLVPKLPLPPRLKDYIINLEA